MDIEFKNDAVCFADGRYWYSLGEGHRYLVYDNAVGVDFNSLINFKDFQLNTIKQGDYIPKSELDTEDKYNRSAEVFRLSGFEFNAGAISEYEELGKDEVLSCLNGCLWKSIAGYYQNKRKLTFNQLMAIGELKRLMNERDKSNHSEKPNGSVSKVNRDIDAFKDGNKYHREIIGLDGTKTTVDVYRVLDAFKTGCPATDHAIKKMLCAGLRGHKDKLTDYDNAIESLEQARALLVQKGIK